MSILTTGLLGEESVHGCDETAERPYRPPDGKTKSAYAIRITKTES
ncbi:hypothetical protein [Bacillus amyloliquefaciens]|nr:hypothetical protein [Bacillus amyloliquefaciens]MEC3841362.1 hypothetical protein [Bacillus amyloliquefaciens]